MTMVITFKSKDFTLF